MNYAQVKAIEQKNKQRLLELNPRLTDKSGIYFLTREADGIKYGYVGQAKHILTRLAQHLVGFQHIDISLKKHGLYSPENPSGWKVKFGEFPEEELDELERHYIVTYANQGYQLRYNHTTGGQDGAKRAMGEGASTRGYRDGLEQGYTNARKFVSKLFDKNLSFQIKGAFTKNKAKAFERFLEFITIESESEEQEDGVEK